MLEDFDDLEDMELEEAPIAPNPSVVQNGKVRKFLLAGNCHCKIENVRTGNCFEYKIQQNKNKKNMYFVNVMSGLGEIYCGYFYTNADDIDYRKGAKGNVDIDDIRIQALIWTLKNSKHLPTYVMVWHFGYCAYCGLPLTNLDAIHCGLCSHCEY